MPRDLLDRIGFRFATGPSSGSGRPPSLDDHVAAALAWISRAHAAAGDGGISKGYHLLRRQWFPSYPETTGYTIPTLLNAALVLERPQVRDMALKLAEYLLSRVTKEGGIAYWRDNRSAVVFDTGQAIFGWLAAYDAADDTRFLEAAVQAGDWLVSVQDPSGAWMRHQHLGVTKVIDTRVAWALLELSDRTTLSPEYRRAAQRNLSWALTQQAKNGWFHSCAFKEGEDPFTHTLAYTAEGLLESGLMLPNDRYVKAARRTAEALLSHQRSNGGLAGAYDAAWRATCRSNCLTGICQMSHLWLRFYELEQRDVYLTAALRAIDFVAGTQDLNGSDPNIRGGIGGSQPIHGRYERFKYPNWAAKFFVDAVLKLKQVEAGGPGLPYVG